jgi:putative transposase
MKTGRPKADLVLSEQERSQLQLFAHSRSLSAALCSRARIVLSSAEGEPNNSIAERLMLTKATVGKWRTRFIEPTHRRSLWTAPQSVFSTSTWAPPP